MLTLELKHALDLLDVFKKSTSEVVPSFAITFMLYRARFCDKEKFKQLVCDFLDVGYNPLKSTDELEKIMITNILSRL